MPSPAEQFFQTVELVELILSHLTLRDLLATQRVNYLWHEVIKASRPMQRSKYLLPDTSTSLAAAGCADTNPLYIQRFVQQACFFALQQLNPYVQSIGMDHFVRRTVKSFAEPKAQWRDMLLFQLPVKLALLKSMSAHYDDGYYYIENNDGLKMSDVVEFFKSKVVEGANAVDLLSATAAKKVVWSVMPATSPEEASDDEMF
jgi:hypothetical protein